MKFIIITIALVAAPLFAAGVQAERIPVMDQKNGAAHSLKTGRTSGIQTGIVNAKRSCAEIA